MGRASREKQERREAAHKRLADAKADPSAWEDKDVSQTYEPPADFKAYLDFHITRKERVVADAPEDHPGDIVPSVQILRDGEHLVDILAREVDRDQMLHAATIAIPGLSASEAIITVDAHYSNKPGPRPGTTWEPHQMQKMCDEEDACSLGLITDCLWIMRFTRDGGREMANLPYHVHKTSRTVAWIEDKRWYEDVSKADGLQMAGFVYETIEDLFDRETLEEAMKSAPTEEVLNDAPPELHDLRERVEPGQPLTPGDFGLDAEEARAHMDMVIYKLLLLNGYAVFVNPPSLKYTEIMERSLGEFSMP